MNAVLQGELHVGFGFLPIREPELLVYEVFDEPLVVCLPSSHPLSVKHTIRPEALEGLPMIAMGRRHLPLSWEETENYFRSLGLELNIVEECFSPNEALYSVAQETGICLLPASLARSGDGVVVRPLSDRLFTHKCGVFVRQDHDDATVEDFSQPDTPAGRCASQSPALVRSSASRRYTRISSTCPIRRFPCSR